jgi:hypothetical protein
MKLRTLRMWLVRPLLEIVEWLTPWAELDAWRAEREGTTKEE